MLLTSSAANPHGFSARVTDFGLARNLDVKARTAPGRYGTVTHMVGWGHGGPAFLAGQSGMDTVGTRLPAYQKGRQDYGNANKNS